MERYESVIGRLKETCNHRTIPLDTVGSGLVDLSTNDYLGLGSRTDLQCEFMERVGDDRLPPFTSSASRLLAASQRYYDELEALLADVYRRPALLFNSGYHANTGAISSLADERTLIIADKLVHASIIDGMRLSGASMERFRHNDVNHLERILSRKAGSFGRVLIITESVFSMDGDKAPLADIVQVKSRYDQAMLYVDEAHAFGVEGQRGLGLCASMPEVDFIVGTLGKAGASVGAFIVCSSLCRDYLLNRTRSFIFSTAIPPFNCAWSSFIIEKILAMDDGRARLRQLGQQLARITGASSGHIQPFVTGSAESALALSSRLLEHGFKVLPIRTPTVPAGTERLRFSLSLDVTEADLERLSAIDLT